MNVRGIARHRVRAVKEIDSKSIVVKLAGSSPVGVVFLFTHDQLPVPTVVPTCSSGSRGAGFGEVQKLLLNHSFIIYHYSTSIQCHIHSFESPSVVNHPE